MRFTKAQLNEAVEDAVNSLKFQNAMLNIELADARKNQIVLTLLLVLFAISIVVEYLQK